MRVNLGVDMQSDVLCLLLSILVSINHKQLEILPVLKDTSIYTLTDASMGGACSGSSASECTLVLEATLVSSPHQSLGLTLF